MKEDDLLEHSYYVNDSRVQMAVDSSNGLALLVK